MIDISSIDDGPTSIHRQRFTQTTAFDPLDLEATAHHIFDAAIAVHERGWIHPRVYHKKVIRGKLMDVSEKCIEQRLARICMCLSQRKAIVDDAIRGGVTLALLCDNPVARGFTKASNNTGNKKRGERLKRAKEVDQQTEEQEEQEEQGELQRQEEDQQQVTAQQSEHVPETQQTIGQDQLLGTPLPAFSETFQEPVQELVQQPVEAPVQYPVQEQSPEPFVEPFVDLFDEPFPQLFDGQFPDLFDEPLDEPFDGPFGEQLPEPFDEQLLEPVPEQHPGDVDLSEIEKWLNQATG